MNGQHRLERIQLVNWGTFHGYFSLSVPRSGLLVTGPSGSGKSSLLDALAAVLVQPRWLTFNAAAQEGTSGDRSRSLVSYVRGAHRRETDDATGEVTTAYLRSNAAWSAIGLTYSDGVGKVTTLVRLMHIGSGTNAIADLKSVFVVAEDELDLLSLQPLAVNGIDQRRLKASYPHTYDNYAAFAARFRRRLGLASEQSQRLLHKTQSAKNLRSLDGLLRDFMLDEPDTFALADAAVEQFGELSAAHESVVDARRQVEALSPLRDYSNNLDRRKRDLAALEAQQSHVDGYLLGRQVAEALADDEIARVAISSLQAEYGRADLAVLAAKEARDGWQRRLDRSGGAELGVLLKAIQTGRQLLEQRRAERLARDRDAAASGLQLPDREQDLEPFTAAVAGQMQQISAEQQTRKENSYDVIHAMRQARDRTHELERDIAMLKTQRSNLDPALLQVRELLVQRLGVQRDMLPFAGELLDVRDTEAVWTGAIERVLRPFARTLLVADELYLDVARLVDQTHLGTRLVFERVLPVGDDHRDLDARSLVAKVQVAEHQHAGWLSVQLRRRYDYMCVERADQMAQLPRAVTLAGQVKHSETRHEKDDRFRIDDRRTWQLGASIQGKLDLLNSLLGQARQAYQEAEREVKIVDEQEAELRDRLAVLGRLATLTWPAIDDQTVATEIAQHEAQVDRIRAAGDLAELERHCHMAEKALSEAEETARRLNHRLESLRERSDKRRLQIQSWQRQLAGLPAVPDDVTVSLTSLFDAHPDDAGLEVIARRVGAALADKVKRSQFAVNKLGNDIERTMDHYKQSWPAPAAELSVQLDFLPDYLAVLNRLAADRLPEFEQRFFDLLARQSRNNIGQLAVRINNAKREIRSRINPINDSLRRTEYAPGRYLQVKLKDRQIPEVTKFLADLAAIVSGSIEDTLGVDDVDEAKRQAEQRFVRMKELLRKLASSEPGHQRWRRECLDTRLHVQFLAVVEDENRKPVDFYVGAGGLSGGERQKLVVFCLAAALRYQLAQEGAERPDYGLVVLDEAFDKTDPEFTRAGLEVFAAFGFQMLLATPLKMLQTLEDYVGGAALVLHDPDKGSHFEVMTFGGSEAAEAEVGDEQGSLL